MIYGALSLDLMTIWVNFQDKLAILRIIYVYQDVENQAYITSAHVLNTMWPLDGCKKDSSPMIHDVHVCVDVWPLWLGPLIL